MPDSDPGTEYVSRVRDLALHNSRFRWLLNYLRRDQQFLANRLSPIQQGDTKTLVADFQDSVGTQPSIDVFAGDGHKQALSARLATRDADTRVRLVFVTSVSGVTADVRTQVCQAQNVGEKILGLIN